MGQYTWGMAKEMSWQNQVDAIRPYIVKIWTPRGSGTGFLLAYSGNRQICGIATAAHVVRQEHLWEQPIRIQHSESETSTMVRADHRAVLLESNVDTAAVVVPTAELPFSFPQDPQPLIESGYYVRVGVEVGWVGFPALSPDNLCFFSGRISCWLARESVYLVDGVAIHGVSGGPAFHARGNGLVVVGVVSAYIPNRATGEALPGLCQISDLSQLQAVVKTLHDFGEAKEKETSSTESQRQPPAENVEPAPAESG